MKYTILKIIQLKNALKIERVIDFETFSFVIVLVIV